MSRANRANAEIVLALLALVGCGQPRAVPEPLDRRYASRDVQADVRQLRAAVYEAAPDLFLYRSAAQIDSAFAALEAKALRPLTAVELWNAMARTLAFIGDGHLEVLPSSSLFATIFQDSTGYVLPFSVRVLDGRLYVFRNHSPNGGPPDGSEIVSVNGVTTSRVLADCDATISVDGIVASRRPRRIENDFAWTCGLAAGLPSRYSLGIVKRGATAIDTMTVRAVPWSIRRRWLAARSPADTAAAKSGVLRMLRGESIAVLELRTFTKDDNFDPRTFIDSAFAAINAASVQTLILDLRPNRGGRDEYGAHLVSRVARDTFTYAKRRALRKRHYDFLEGFDGWLLNLQLRFRYARHRDSTGAFVLRQKLDGPQSPNARPFRGRVIALVDGTTVSTGTSVAAALQHYGLATIVGEETANAWSGGSGATEAMELKHTKLLVNVPLVQYRLVGFENARAGRGVQPDVEVPRTIDDLLAGRDRAMETALELARGSRIDDRD